MVGFRKTRTVSMPTAGKKAAAGKGLKRSASVPGTAAEIRSAMRVSSLDESLHKKGLAKNPKRPSGIVFHEIRIREYARALGDNPSCSAGPPVSIGWEYSPKEIHIKLEKYEEKRPDRRSMQEMVLPRDVRFKMLTQEWDVSRKDCADATRQSLKVKNQRRQTVRNLGKAPAVEESIENVGKKFKKSLFGGKKSDKDLEKMMKAADSAASNKKKMASEEYEWEPDEDLSNGSANSRQESKSREEYDPVGMPYEDDNEHAPEEDEGEPETARPRRVNPAITKKVVRGPRDSLAPRRSLNGSSHGRPIIISEDDCEA